MEVVMEHIDYLYELSTKEQQNNGKSSVVFSHNELLENK